MNKYLFCIFFFIFNSICAYGTENFPIMKYLVPIEVKECDTGLESIDCIYVINLPHRGDRWKHMQRFFKKYNLHVNRVPAVNGWKFSKAQKAELTSPYRWRRSPGALGCLLSHVSILKDAYDREFSLIWILEDDAEFLEDPASLVPILSTLFAIDPDWDLLYTDRGYRIKGGRYLKGWWPDVRPHQKARPLSYYLAEEDCTEDILRIRSRIGTHSMILTRNGIKKLLDYFTSRPIWTAIDVDIHETPNLREYCCKRDIVTNSVGIFFSDITKSNRNKRR